MLSVGDPAPHFTLPNQDELPRSLDHARGKTVVLYFYPKDMTPGCTTEACDVRDVIIARQLPDDTIIYGVSADSPASHRRFIAKHGLNFDLLSDETGEMLTAYGVWTQKKMMGRKYMGIERSTFVIGPDGKILKIYRGVKVSGHIQQVVGAL